MICLGGKGKYIYWLCGSRRYRALHANITLSHIYTLHLASIFRVRLQRWHDGMETAKAGRSTQQGDVDGSVVMVGLRLLVSLRSADSGVLVG
jgi:hypothetical protein